MRAVALLAITCLCVHAAQLLATRRQRSAGVLHVGGGVIWSGPARRAGMPATAETRGGAYLGYVRREAPRDMIAAAFKIMLITSQDEDELPGSTKSAVQARGVRDGKAGGSYVIRRRRS